MKLMLFIIPFIAIFSIFTLAQSLDIGYNNPSNPQVILNTPTSSSCSCSINATNLSMEMDHNLLNNLDWNSNGHPHAVEDWNVTMLNATNITTGRISLDGGGDLYSFSGYPGSDFYSTLYGASFGGDCSTPTTIGTNLVICDDISDSGLGIIKHGSGILFNLGVGNTYMALRQKVGGNYGLVLSQNALGSTQPTEALDVFENAKIRGNLLVDGWINASGSQIPSGNFTQLNTTNLKVQNTLNVSGQSSIKNTTMNGTLHIQQNCEEGGYTCTSNGIDFKSVYDDGVTINDRYTYGCDYRYMWDEKTGNGFCGLYDRIQDNYMYAWNGTAFTTNTITTNSLETNYFISHNFATFQGFIDVIDFNNYEERGTMQATNTGMFRIQAWNDSSKKYVENLTLDASITFLNNVTLNLGSLPNCASGNNWGMLKPNATGLYYCNATAWGLVKA